MYVNMCKMCKFNHFFVQDNHHLKHDARQQLGLFLKGIGVTMEDSVAFWREEFMKGACVCMCVYVSVRM